MIGIDGTTYETRTGLEYRYDGQERIYYYRPAAVFFVDGIRYDPGNTGPYQRPMIEMIDDRLGSPRVTMSFAMSSTAELRRFLDDGIDPSR